MRKEVTFRLRRIALVALMALFSVAFLANGAVASSHMKPGKGVSVQPVWSSIAEEWFQYYIMMQGLEELGYKVKEPLEVEITSAHLAVGSGDADFYAVHWEPLQNNFYEQAGGDAKVKKVGVQTGGALQGYLIDKKTAEKYGINNLGQLKDPKIAKLFDTNGDGKADLTGCNPGWGCEKVIEHQLTAFDLRDTVTHNQGSYFALIADTLGRFNRGEPILYYTWTPLWVSGVLVPGENVTWLNVPFTSHPSGLSEKDTTLPDGTNVGFAINNIRVMANKKFIEANPAAEKFFEMVKIPVNDIGAQNKKMQDGEKSMKDIKRHAQEWIKTHRAEFDKWLDAARKAAA